MTKFVCRYEARRGFVTGYNTQSATSLPEVFENVMKSLKIDFGADTPDLLTIVIKKEESRGG